MTSEWQWLTLSDVLVPQGNRKPLQQGWSPQCHPHPAESGKWGVLKTTAVQAGSYEPTHNKELPETLDPRPQFEVRAGDLLMTCAGPRARCGVPTLVRHTPERLIMSGKMYRFRPDERLDPRFLELWLLSAAAQRRIDAMKTGISDSGLNLTHDRFVQLPVPVPSLDEQRRIVDLLEDHLSRLDAADGYLGTAKRRLRSLQAGALAGVFSGETVTLGELAVASGYGTSEKCVVGGPGPAVVRIPNLIDGFVNLTDEKRVADPAADVTRSMLALGDLLIVRTNGSVDLIGRSAVVQPGVDAAFASYLIRYRLDPARVFPEWVHAMLSAPQSRARLERLAASSAGQHNLSLGKLDGVPIPLPTLERQESHLRRLADLGSELSRLTHALQAASRHAAHLRRALLAAAFSGRLTGAASDVTGTEVVKELAGV